MSCGVLLLFLIFVNNMPQVGFSLFGSCISQLLSINHDVFSNCDCDPLKDAHAGFLDIFKAFDKIWIPILIFKFKPFELFWWFEASESCSVCTNVLMWKKLMLDCLSAQLHHWFS